MESFDVKVTFKIGETPVEMTISEAMKLRDALVAAFPIFPSLASDPNTFRIQLEPPPQTVPPWPTFPDQMIDLTPKIVWCSKPVLSGEKP